MKRNKIFSVIALCIIVAMGAFFFSALMGCTPLDLLLTPFSPSWVGYRSAEGAEIPSGETVSDSEESGIDSFFYYYDKLGSPVLFVLFVIVKWIILPLKSACKKIEEGAVDLVGSIKNSESHLESILKQTQLILVRGKGDKING